MIGFALVVAAGAGSTGAVSFDPPRILSLLRLHHGQDHPEHVEKDLVPAKVVGATWRLVERAGLVELVDILRDRWGVHHIYPRNENEPLLRTGLYGGTGPAVPVLLQTSGGDAQPSSADGP